MTALQDWMASPAVRAMAWALVHFLWQGAAVSLVLAVALWCSRKSRTRYLLACGAMVSMVLAFAVTLAVCWPANPARSGGPVPAGALHLAPLVPDDGTFVVPRESAPPRWFVPAWLGGVSLFYLYSLIAWLAATRMKRRGTVAAPLVWQERLERLALTLGLRRTIVLLESCLAEVPVVIGYFRPVILLPLGLLAGLETEQVEAILIHELAHIRRYDYLVNVMQSLVEGLLFYHPAVWWVGSVMRGEREHSCDDIVVALQGDARGYAVTLARLELSRGAMREPMLAATGGNLMKRVHRLMQQPEGPRVAVPLVSAMVLLATATVALAAWQSQTQTQTPTKTQTPPPAAQQQQPAQHLVEPLPHGFVETMPQTATPPAARPQLDTPYRRWLTEDVAYIITDSERTAYKQLTTDGERDQFIEEFWLRRDPTSATPANEFKEEHYRRIAYANEQYSASIPGWKTDRGRIYITYGPPDEIDAHTSGGLYVLPQEQGGATVTTYPFQQWRYQHIDGIGNDVIVEFVDRTRTGEYRLTMDPKEKEIGKEPLEIGVNVQPSPASHSRLVALSARLDNHGHPTHVQGLVETPGGRSVSAFEIDVRGPQERFEKSVPLMPGSYRAIFAVKDLTSGDFQRAETMFNVH